jgi:hypothetical protein
LIAVVIVLVVTNLLSVAAAIWLWRERTAGEPAPAPEIAALLDTIAAQPTAVSGVRRIISVEILNPLDLAGTRGRVVGIAGSFAPSITRRVVNEQAVKTLRRQLAEQHVVADVRLHTLRPQDTDPATTGGPPPSAPFGYPDEADAGSADADGPGAAGAGPRG